MDVQTWTFMFSGTLSCQVCNSPKSANSERKTDIWSKLVSVVCSLGQCPTVPLAPNSVLKPSSHLSLPKIAGTTLSVSKLFWVESSGTHRDFCTGKS